MADRNDVGKILVAFFIGGVAGVLAGLLLAPSSGSETRQKIKDATITAKDKAWEKIEEAKSEASSLLGKGKEKMGDVKTQIQAAVEAGKKAYKQEKDALAPEPEEEA